jgi:uncharacterized protein YlxP (DUF503 family)
MYVGILQVELELPEPTTLKDKRNILRSIKDRLRRKFEVAVAEVGPLQIKREATLGIAVVSNEPKHARARIQSALEWLESHPDVRVSDSSAEVL